MITKTYRSFLLWIAGVALAATAIAYFVPSKIVHPTPTTQHVTARGAHTTVSAASSTQNTKTTAPAETGAAAAPSPEVTSLTYPKLKAMLDKEPQSIKGFVFESSTANVTVKLASGRDITVVVPDADAKVELRKKADELKIDYDVKSVSVESSSSGGGMMNTFLIMGLFIVGGAVVSVLLQRWLASRMQQGGGGAGSGFAKSPAKNVNELGERKDKVTFDDVAGCDEAVAEMRRVVKGLVDRSIYQDFDGELPPGVLLLGPPGTGKTLLAKAAANECGGGMYSLAGSDFVEMFVGVGAGRIRDTFAKARKEVDETGKPVIIFIDEFDAIGGKRGNGVNGNQERENTLNALLVEMDGMHTNKGILVLAATNRADMLDDALLRPGRFEAHVSVDLPDVAGREKIFAIHTRKKKLASSVSAAILAARSYGYSGAEIKGACNRAAIIAAERWVVKSDELKAAGKTAEQIAAELPKEIELHDFDEGIDFVRLGGAKKSSQATMAVEDKLNTAYHEGGHALVAAVLKGSDPVVKITIMRRARALGYVQYMPNTDRVSFSDEQAIARIICAMAGRAAQEVYLNKVDTGASNDFEQASDMARNMVTKWGMSRIGRISVGQRGPAIAGYGHGGEMGYGSELANEIDREWRRIVDECYKIARYVVETEKSRMEALVPELMKNETMLSPRWKEFLQEYPSAVDLDRVQFNAAA